MRKKSKWLVGLFMTGILITGIGCGIAFAEYSSFEFGGETILEGSEYFTRTIDYKLNLWPNRVNKAMVYLHVYEDYEFVKDTNLEKDEVQFVVHYLSNDTSITPEVHTSGAYGEFYEGLYLDCNLNYYVDDLELIMRMKDQVLSDFKQRKISSYQNDKVEKVEIHIHPEALFELVTG